MVSPRGREGARHVLGGLGRRTLGDDSRPSGPAIGAGRRGVGVSLQLRRDGGCRSFLVRDIYWGSTLREESSDRLHTPDVKEG